MKRDSMVSQVMVISFTAYYSTHNALILFLIEHVIKESLETKAAINTISRGVTVALKITRAKSIVVSTFLSFFKNQHEQL